MNEKIMNLLSVKSIVTIVTTAVFSYLAVSGRVSSAEFLTIFTMVVSFYFGTQAEKRSNP